MALDRIKVEVMASGMDYEKFKNMPAEPWQKYATAIIFTPIIGIASFWAFSGLIGFFQVQWVKPTIAAYFAVAIITFVVAGIAYFLREVVKTIYYPISEVGVGLAAAAQAVSPQAGDLARLVALLAGVRITVDGFTRFFKFMEDATPKPSATKTPEADR